MPKKLIAVAPGKAALVDYEEAKIRPNQVKVSVEYASPKHGTEVSLFRGEDPFVADLFDEDWRLFLQRETEGREAENGEGPALGNQWVGVVVEKGSDVGHFRVGNRVCGYGSIRETQILDAVDNPFLLKVPDTMPWKSALCFDPAQFALGGIRDGHVRIGDRVVVFGLGAIGAIAAQMAKVAGAAYVAVIDPIEKRRHAAVDAGADAAFDPLREDVGLELKKATGRAGVDAAIETSGNEQALQQALRGLAYGGTIAFVGWARAFSGTLDLSREAHFNNAVLVFSRASSEPNRDHPRWNRRRIAMSCWNMLASGAIDCEKIIDPVVSFDESPRAYEEYVDRNPQQSIKLGVAFI
ncbi:MAG: zinc-binding alcohol dehydrogenase [Rubrobacteraceae bacterium]|nr:zinc-binding alcohol dehydrogenase [Rubrobacteraceae bacterium]